MKSRFIPGVFVGLLLGAALAGASSLHPSLIPRLDRYLRDKATMDSIAANNAGYGYAAGFLDGESNGLWIAATVLETGILPE